MVYIILGKGFEPVEAIAPCDILRRGGVDVKLAGIGGKTVEAAHGVTVAADCTVEEIDQNALEMIVLPGGLGGVESILGCQAALDAVKRAWDGGKYVAAICAGPTVLAKLGITAGRRATCYPGCEDALEGAQLPGAGVVTDGKITTGKAAGTVYAFAYELARLLCGEEAADRVRAGMYAGEDAPVIRR